MARIGKKSAPAPKAKGDEKKTRKAPVVKSCCGAQRGHKPDCTTLEIADNDPSLTGVEPIDENGDGLFEQEAGISSVAAGTDQSTLFAILRGWEESFSRIADSMAIIAAGSPRLAAVAAEAAPRAPRKAKAAQEQPPAAPVAQAPAQASEDAGAVDLMDDEPTPAPAPKAAPPAKAAPAPTVDEVRTTFLGFASRKGRDSAVAILSRFNVAKLGELDAKQYPALLAALKEG